MLSDKAIQALRPDPSRSGTKHHDRDGLYLWVARSGSKTWRKDYRWEGVRQTFTIGTYPKVRLADARKVAMQINDWLREGIDPRTQSSRQRRERERPEAKPFREVAEAWLAHHATAWSPRYRRDMREKLDHFVLPALGEVAIGVLGRMERHNLSASGAAHHLMRLGAGLSPLPPLDQPAPTPSREEPTP
jgi:hypothetical protein